MTEEGLQSQCACQSCSQIRETFHTTELVPNPSTDSLPEPNTAGQIITGYSACILMANILPAERKLCYFNPSSRWSCSVFEGWHFQQLQSSTNAADGAEHAGWHCWMLLQKPHKTFPDNDTYFLPANSNSWFSLTHSFVSARLKKTCTWSQANSAFTALVRRSKQRKVNTLTHTLGRFTCHQSHNVPS